MLYNGVYRFLIVFLEILYCFYGDFILFLFNVYVNVELWCMFIFCVCLNCVMLYGVLDDFIVINKDIVVLLWCYKRFYLCILEECSRIIDLGSEMIVCVCN